MSTSSILSLATVLLNYLGSGRVTINSEKQSLTIEVKKQNGDPILNMQAKWEPLVGKTQKEEHAHEGEATATTKQILNERIEELDRCYPNWRK